MSKLNVPSDDTNQTSIEWLLTKQFADESYHTLIPIKGTKQSWRDQMVQFSMDADFLSYAMLSVTASHVALDYPQSRHSYAREADKYRNLAIQRLPAPSKKVCPENFFAFFNFSRLMTLCWLAKVQLSGLETKTPSRGFKSLLPEWVPIQRQGRKLIWPHRGEGRIVGAMQGPPQLDLAAETMQESDMPHNPHDSKLEKLTLALQALPNALVDDSCLDALHLLRNSWALPHKNNASGFRDVALMWTARVDTKYLDLLCKNDPTAIIVFAYYCVLWSLSESRYWYMKGHAPRMLSRAVDLLGSEWHDWIAWPRDMVFGDCAPSSSFEKAVPISD